MSTPRAILLPTLGRCKRGRRGGGSNVAAAARDSGAGIAGAGLLRVERSGPESAGMLSIAPFSPADQGHAHVRDTWSAALPKWVLRICRFRAPSFDYARRDVSCDCADVPAP